MTAPPPWRKSWLPTSSLQRANFVFHHNPLLGSTFWPVGLWPGLRAGVGAGGLVEEPRDGGSLWGWGQGPTQEDWGPVEIAF